MGMVESEVWGEEPWAVAPQFVEETKVDAAVVWRERRGKVSFSNVFLKALSFPLVSYTEFLFALLLK